MASRSGATVKDVPAQVFITTFAAHLKKSGKIELPEWHDLVKTAVFKEMPPINADWYFVRAASIARKVYLRGGTGVGALAKVYGGSKSNGVAPEHFRKASKGLIRHILQALESNDWVAKKKGRNGRWLTKAGQSELDTIANQIIASGVKLVKEN